MAVTWKFDEHGNLFSYDDVTLKVFDIAHINKDGKIETVNDGVLKLAYLDSENKILDKDGGTGAIAPRAMMLGSYFEVKKDDFESYIGGFYGVDTTDGEVKTTLPSNPKNGDIIWFIDIKNNFNSDVFVLHASNTDHNIMGSSDDTEVDVDGLFFGLLFVNNDWRVM